MSEQEVTYAVAALVRDLMFAGRIAAEARAAGVPVRMVREPADLTAIVADRLIVDLNQPGALEAAGAWKRLTGKSVTGFVAHVDADTIAKARMSGIDQVMPRSQFVVKLPAILAAHVGAL